MELIRRLMATGNNLIQLQTSKLINFLLSSKPHSPLVSIDFATKLLRNCTPALDRRRAAAGGPVGPDSRDQVGGDDPGHGEHAHF